LNRRSILATREAVLNLLDNAFCQVPRRGCLRPSRARQACWFASTKSSINVPASYTEGEQSPQSPYFRSAPLTSTRWLIS
jgi:hypothetical protein